MGLLCSRVYQKHFSIEYFVQKRTALFNSDAFCYFMSKMHLIFDTDKRHLYMQQQTFLHAAIRRSYLRLARALIKYAAKDVNAQDERGETPLHYAVHCNNLEAVSLLLYYGADPDIASATNFTPFMHAVFHDQEDIAKALLDHCHNFSNVLRNGFPFMQMRIVYERMFIFVDKGLIFKKLWSKLDHRVLLHKKSMPFFVDYIHYTFNFPRCIWLECLYTILKSPGALALLEDCTYSKVNSESVIEFLMCCFLHVGVEQDDRIAVLSLCLSLGCPIQFQDLNVTHLYCGHSKELNLLLHIYKPLEDTSLTSLISYILCSQEDPSLVLDSFKLYGPHFERLTVTRQQRHQLFNQLRFFALSVPKKNALLDVSSPFLCYHKALSKKLNTIPTVPSLMELSRNRVHGCIRPKFKNISEFYGCVNSLVVPENVKNVLIFKTPLYGNR